VGIIDRLAARFGYRKADQVQADWLRVTANDEQWAIPDRSLPQAQSELYLRLSWVQAAVAGVARTAATTGFSVSQLKGEDTQGVENHPFELLLRRPNPLQSRFELLEATISFHALTGNAYWWLNRANENAEPNEIWIIPPHRIQPVPDGRMFLRGYMYESDAGEKIPLERHEIVHFKRFHPLNSFVGLSPIEALATIAQGDLAMQRWNTNYFDKDNAKVPGALAFADPIENDAWEKIKADVNAKHGGTKRQMMMLRNVGKGGVQWISMALSQRDMEFLSGRTFNKEEIFSIYAPGYASMLAVNATEANSNAGKSTFMEMAVWPQLVSIAEKITNDLLPAYGNDLVGAFDDVRIADRGMQLAEQNAASQVQTIDEMRQGFYSMPPLADNKGARLLSEPVQQAAAQPDESAGRVQLAQTYNYQITAGIITREEARAGLGLPPLPQPPPSEYKAKFEAIAAGVGLGIPPEALFQLMGLPPALLPSVDSVTVQPQRQLPAPQEQPPPDQPQGAPADAPPDTMRQQEAKAYRKWLKRDESRQPDGFKAAYLTDADKATIYADVRDDSAKALRFIPRGNDEPLPPVPSELQITDDDIEHAIAAWDRTFPNYAGLLEADAQSVGSDL